MMQSDHQASCDQNLSPCNQHTDYFLSEAAGTFKSREREQSDFLTFWVIGIWRGVFFNSLLSLLGDHLNFFAGDL